MQRKSIYALIQRFLEKIFFNEKNSNGNVILMFHRISKNSSNKKEYIVNEIELKQFLSKLKNYIIPMKDLLKKRGVIITFDDGDESIYNLLFPFLIENEIPITIFLITQRIDCNGYLSIKEIIDMKNSGLVTFGSHSLTHQILRYSKEQKNEIKESKCALEDMGITVDYFAYPYGSVKTVSLRNVFEVKKAGYKYAFTTFKGYPQLKIKMNAFFLPRFNGDMLIKNDVKDFML